MKPLPNMPEGYYLMSESGRWKIMKTEGPFLKPLLDNNDDEIYFDDKTSTLAEAAEYAQKHKDLNLTYDQSVPEVQS